MEVSTRSDRIATPASRRNHKRRGEAARRGWTSTFLYRDLSPDALAIPPLAVEVDAKPWPRRKPVPAPKPVGGAPHTSVPSRLPG